MNPFKIERLNTAGKVLDGTTSAIITKQDEIVDKINEMIDEISKMGEQDLLKSPPTIYPLGTTGDFTDSMGNVYKRQ